MEAGAVGFGNARRDDFDAVKQVSKMGDLLIGKREERGEVKFGLGMGADGDAAVVLDPFDDVSGFTKGGDFVGAEGIWGEAEG